MVNKEMKKFDLTPIFLCKSSQEFSRKNECDNILNSWKMLFQVSDDKGQHFLELLDDNLNLIEPSVVKCDLQLKYFGHSNLLCTRVTRAIINYVLIGEYRLRFFPQKEFKCPCCLYPIESRWHILYKCKIYNNYRNPRRDSGTFYSFP